MAFSRSPWSLWPRPRRPAQPAPTSNYTSFEATSAKPVQLGYYASAHKNCTPSPLATIRIIEPPKMGILTVRVGVLKTNSTVTRRWPNGP